MTKGKKYPIGERNVTGLAAGAFDTATTVITIPSVPTGGYYLEAIADSENVIAELNENNNGKLGNAISISSVLPDLLMKDVAASVSGGQIKYSGTLKNQGTQAASCRVGVYLSTDTVFDSTDTLIAATYSYYIPGGGQAAVSGSASVPYNIAGN